MDSNAKIGRLAMTLAISEDGEEAALKEKFSTIPSVKHLVTYVAGKSATIQNTIAKTVISNAIQAEIIQNSPTKIHGLLHAVLGAYTALRQDGLVVSDLKVKVAVVTDGKWIAVAMYGNSAFHFSTSHERASLHIMHL